MKPYRLAFAGTPKIAVPCLAALVADERFEIVAVITQPDMPAGRNLELTPPPIKTFATGHDLEVMQPQKISQIADQLRGLELDAIVVVAYAQIIPQSILDLPKYGCVNVHGSLLPKYRGAAVLQAPILNNDEETGVTIMLMDKNLDTGPILKQRSFAISQNETAGTLGEKMAEIGAKLLPDTLIDYFQGRIKPQEQNNEFANYVGRLSKEDGLIDWTKPAKEVECFVRAMTPWPSAWTWVAGKKLKILEVDPNIIGLTMHKPGKTFIYNSTLAVQCKEGSLIIRRLQLEGKNPMGPEEFMRGYQDFIGSVLG
jgi:methionyl-tRNA formyltransferase